MLELQHRETPNAVRSYISSNRLNFNDLSLQIHQYQIDRSETYAYYCQAITLQTQTETSWEKIPALTTNLFKAAQLTPRTFPEKKSTTHFLTSGTTQDKKGIHYFQETKTYETSIVEGWKHYQLPENLPLYFLAQDPSNTPHSSLAWMFKTLHQHLDPNNPSPFLLKPDQSLNSEALNSLPSSPFILFGTAINFLRLLETKQLPPLPEGSHLIETGGYKGLNITTSKSELYEQLTSTLKVPTERIHNEYSMTELSSQAYTSGLGNPHQTPPWMKVQVINPETNQAVGEGGTGYLQLHDLANYHSAQVIRTQDLAIFHDHHHFTLIGRDPSALPRGCSRASS